MEVERKFRDVEGLDFSGLFKVETLLQVDVLASCFYEVGLQKLVAVAGQGSLDMLHINSVGTKTHKSHPWDFKVYHSITCMCFEPSGTWLLVVTGLSVALVPFLPIFEPNSNYDHKWSLTEPTIIPFISNRPTSISWWLTKEAENIAIIALRSGIILFFSLDTKTLLRETKVPIDVSEIQISVDDSLDLIVLLITGFSGQWKLVLEQRGCNYNWIRSASVPTYTKDKRDGLISCLADMITTFTHASASSELPVPIELTSEPTEYLPAFRKGSQDWSLSVQYVNGRHFITAFDLKTGTLITENIDDRTPSRTLHVSLDEEQRYRQALWSPKLLYLLTDTTIEVHSTAFATVQDNTKGVENTLLWSTELSCGLRRAHLLSAREVKQVGAWSLPTFLCDLQLPRFPLQSCLVIGAKGVFLLTTMWEPCEWLVGMIMRGGRGADRSAAALGAPLDTMLRAAADMLLSRGKMPPAKYLYTLSKAPAEGWLVRLGVFGLTEELAAYTTDTKSAAVNTDAVMMRVLAQILALTVQPQRDAQLDVHLHLSETQLEELCDLAACLGLWHVLSCFSIHKGLPHLVLAALNSRARVCRGSLHYLLAHTYLAMYLLEMDAEFMYKFLRETCHRLDTVTLKRLCRWMSPLSEQMRPVLRDLKDEVLNTYTSRLEQLIGAWMSIVCELDFRLVSPAAITATITTSTSDSDKFVPRRSLSCGLVHWAIVDGGDAAVLLARTPVKTELIGRVMSVACGRHHTLVLTENGVYAAGDNTHGQLGIGVKWEGRVGNAAGAGGGLVRVRYTWPQRVTSIAAGQYHSTAITRGGRLYMWGWGVHGQLGLGNTYDALAPQLVTSLQGTAVVSVGCGACHTVALTDAGEVWCWGAGAFGQLGSGGQHKSSVPLRVPLHDPVIRIAVGYFNAIALTATGTLWRWGASPQTVRAAVPLSHRVGVPPPTDEAPSNPHLLPTKVDTSAVLGRIVQLSSGWHHNCLLDHLGNIYTWGLNFDGQLGTGDRKQVPQPRLVEIAPQVDEVVQKPAACDNRRDADYVTASHVACGGDFTVFVNDAGKIYVVGNMHEQNESSKEDNRVIMMRTTKRVIKIPALRAHSRFLFQYLDKLDNLLVHNRDDRAMIDPANMPISGEEWVDEIVRQLGSWIKPSHVATNPNVTAKLAYRNEKYADCLKYRLQNLTHVRSAEDVCEDDAKHDVKGNIKTTIKNRIKEVGLAYLNEKPYPELTGDIYASLPCSCKELKGGEFKAAGNIDEKEKCIDKKALACEAAKIIDDALGNCPANYEAWDEYLSLAKEFFIQNSLPGDELEAVLRKYIETNGNLVSSAVMFSDECASYEKLLTPKFYLNVCSKIIDSSG